MNDTLKRDAKIWKSSAFRQWSESKVAPGAPSSKIFKPLGSCWKGHWIWQTWCHGIETPDTFPSPRCGGRASSRFMMMGRKGIYIYRVLLQYENIWIGFLGEHVLVYSLLKMIMEMHYPWILLPKLGILVRNGWFKIMLVSTRVQKADAAQLRAAPARRTKRNGCGPSWPEPTWLRRFMTATRPRTDRLAVPRCTDWMCIPVSKRM